MRFSLGRTFGAVFSWRKKSTEMTGLGRSERALKQRNPPYRKLWCTTPAVLRLCFYQGCSAEGPVSEDPECPKVAPCRRLPLKLFGDVFLLFWSFRERFSNISGYVCRQPTRPLLTSAWGQPNLLSRRISGVRPKIGSRFKQYVHRLFTAPVSLGVRRWSQVSFFPDRRPSFPVQRLSLSCLF